MPDHAAIARELIDSNAYMTLATADLDGRPWASPVPPAALRLYVATASAHFLLAADDQRLAVELP